MMAIFRVKNGGCIDPMFSMVVPEPQGFRKLELSLRRGSLGTGTSSLRGFSVRTVAFLENPPPRPEVAFLVVLAEP